MEELDYSNVESIYYDAETGFNSFDKFWKKVKHLKISQNKVREWFNSQRTYQLNKEVKKPSQYSTIFSIEPKQIYQLDIMIYNRFKMNNYKYILTVIDVYSRYAEARAMTTYDMKKVITNTEDIFNHMGFPKYLTCDNQFNNNEFLDFCKQHNITVYFSEPNEINKNAIIERFNRTLAKTLQKWRNSEISYASKGLNITNSNQWYKILPRIIRNYNNTYHRTIESTPLEVFNGWRENKQKIITLKHKLKIGDSVRARNKEDLDKAFAKGDTQQFSGTIYKIVNKKGDKFYLEDEGSKNQANAEGNTLRNGFKEYELQRV